MRRRILVVEDDALTRKFYVAAIRSHLAEVDIVETSSVAHARTVVDWLPDLVITDILLGDGNGLDVLAAVRSSPNPNARVVAVTGLTGSELDALRQQGFDTILTKPVELAELRDVIVRVFRAT